MWEGGWRMDDDVRVWEGGCVGGCVCGRVGVWKGGCVEGWVYERVRERGGNYSSIIK